MLKRGDLCLVLSHHAIFEYQRKYVGTIVTLTHQDTAPQDLKAYGPYWCTVEHGNAPRFGEVILRKLEPPSDDEYEKFRNKLDLGVKKDDLVTTD